ncbi:lysophospholipase [Taibaiella sp. KBW10]|uniref:SGNH/GDSL hydrolase family protein n=1 Tax=Taibaiella sp. KBW10 TaxID=2153357 RepID=UPI000F59719C|nr:SGNH/GDSL hydrolase family protein [Taibaiella sp. KBW10]RQO30643.1 lysophospholipase [Taibaiella sp. KBW10]
MQTYLALGDSYTIGEGVETAGNFPNQLVQILKEQYQLAFAAPEIIAVTGWTTDELLDGIAARNLEQTFDLVTLLIGVNNQYRGRDLDNYTLEFTRLLEQAIAFAKGDKQKVCVVSIPDWGHTPFAVEKGVDTPKVTREIAAFNACQKAIALQYGVTFVDITGLTDQYKDEGAYLVEDQLHYSSNMYALWAAKIAAEMHHNL